MRKITVTGLCVILAFSSAIVVLDLGEDFEVEAKEVVGDGINYIASAPFRINSDADFTTSPKVSGGNGTVWSPWIIEGWDINGTGVGYCIYIGNTTDRFEVRDCYLHEASGVGSWPYYDDAGIILVDVDNGLITNNNVTMNDGDGIYVYFYCEHNLTLFKNL